MNNTVIKFLSTNTQWDLSRVTSIESIGGLTNDNFKLLYDNQPYFIRICRNDFSQRNLLSELNILKKASNLDLCPYPVYFNKINGNMITHWINGIMPTEKQSNSRYIIKNLILKTKSLHQLEHDFYFNPFNEIRNKIKICNEKNIILPVFFNTLLKKLCVIENELNQTPLLGLCHNDLNPSNILLTENNLYIIDYELSGINDVFFDLATIAWLLNPESRKTLLIEYFGCYNENDYNKLINYLFVVKMLNSLWSLLKSLDNSTSYNYAEGSNIIFKELLNFKIQKGCQN